MKNLSFAVSHLFLAAVLCLGTLIAAPSVVHATAYTVNALTDTRPTLGGLGAGTAGDLRYCITQAGYGAAGSVHTITFGVTGTITLGAHELVINSDLTITGPGSGKLTIDANAASRVVFIVSGYNVTLSGLTLTNGSAVGNDTTGLDAGTLNGLGGGVLNDRSVLTLGGCKISNCAGSSTGGAGLFNRAQDADATLALNNCIVTGNRVTQYSNGGGGIQNYSGGTGVATLSISGGTISDNVSTDQSGGGISNIGNGAASNLAVSGCAITGNSTAVNGGGIYSNGIASVSITGSTISGNSSSNSGGGVLQTGNGAMTLLGCTVTGNTSTGTGGGIANAGYENNPTLTVSHCTISGNDAGTSGGGINNSAQYATSVTTTVANSTISGNSAQQRGGGIYNYSNNNGQTATLIVSNSTLTANTSLQRGGGVNNYADGGTAATTVANSTLAGNSALSGGAGIANDRQQTGSLAATVTLTNTILALHPTGANYGTAYGIGVSGGYNLSDDATCSAFLTVAGDRNNTLAGLQVDGQSLPLLADNGGDTETIALLAGSAALDGGKAATDPLTGLPTTADQRGLLRPFDRAGYVNAVGGDGSDIGAFESGGSAPAAPVVGGEATAVGQVDVAFSYQIAATGSPASYAAVGLPTGLVLNPATGLISGTPSTTATFTVRLSATNAGGTGTKTLTLTIAPAGPAPVITSAGTATGQVGVAFSYLIVGTHSPYNFAATSLPPGLSVDAATGIVSGTPTVAGFYNATLSATNSSGTGSRAFGVTVAAAPPVAPVINSATAVNGQVGAAFSYKITALNTPTRFAASPLPAGLSVNATTGVISGKPTVAGSYTVTLSASNAGGTGTASLLVVIASAVPAPVITSAAAASAQVGVAFSYRITATNTPTRFGATGLPTGLSVNNATGVISGQPVAAGTAHVTVSATNGTGTGTRTVTLTIAPAGVAPVIDSATSATAVTGQVFSYQITALHSPTAFQTSALPKGLSLNAATGVISGRPTVAGTYTLGLYASNAYGTGQAGLTLMVTAPVIPTQPTVLIVSPPNGLTVAVGAYLPLTASLNDPDGALAQVQFFVNNQVVAGFSPGVPLTTATALPLPGTYQLEAIATDTQGRTSTSTVTINAITPDSLNPAPSTTLLTPVNGRTFAAGSTLTLTAAAGTASPAGLRTVAIYVEGVPIATFDGAGQPLAAGQPGGSGAPVRRDASIPSLNTLFTTNYTLPPGIDKLLNLIVIATDNLGNSTVSGQATLRSKVADDQPPAVAINSPVTMTTVVIGTPVNVGIAASSATLAKVEYFVNGIADGSATAPTFGFAFAPTAAGKYELEAVATDGSGLSTVSASVVLEAVTPESLFPTVTITAAGDGLAIEGGENGKVAVHRTGDLSAELTVFYKVKGAAKSGVDYKPVTNSVTIPAGAAQAKIKIKPINNDTVDGTRVAKVKLLPADGVYNVGDPSLAKIKIIDND